MPRNFDWLIATSGSKRGPRFWLQVTGATLALLNGAALFFYLDPPGGSRNQLAEEGMQVRNQIIATRVKAMKMKTASAKVQLSNTESSDFASKYFLPKRLAYAAVIAEIQRMAKASGLQERDAVFTEEPIEGTADLSILNSTANYEGSYANLMQFVYQVDQSPMLLMLENLQAAPQQKGGQIATSIHFQTIVQEEPVTMASVGGQP